MAVLAVVDEVDADFALARDDVDHALLEALLVLGVGELGRVDEGKRGASRGQFEDQGRDDHEEDQGDERAHRWGGADGRQRRSLAELREARA